MTERATNERRHWKGIVFPFDVFVDDTSEECLYCLTENQATLIRGLLEPVAWKTRWWSDTQDIDQDYITAYRDDMIRRLMMACCGGDFEIIYAWTEDGELTQSNDGGVTYEPVPQEDPRNSSPVFPPVAGEPSDDKKCIAATGMALLVKEGVGDQLTDDMGRYTLGQLIKDWVTTVIQTSNPFLALINIITNQIFALLISAVRAALTSDVYDQLACIFLANMEDDLSFTDEEWENVRSQIIDQIDGIAGVFLEHLVFLLGRVGLTNLARSQAASEGDCACDDRCSLDSWILYDAGAGDINEGTRTAHFIEIDAMVRGDGKYYVIFMGSDSMDCCTFDVTSDAGSDIFVTSGTANVSVYQECGETPSDVAIAGTPLGFGTFEMNAVLYRGDTPFTLRISN